MDTRYWFNTPLSSDDAISYSPLFPFYLIEKLQPGQINKDIIRQTWTQYQQTGNCGSAKPVIDSILPQGQKMSNIFPNYAEANYFLAYPAPPDIRGALQARGQPQDYRPAHSNHILNDQTQSVRGPSNNTPSYGGLSIEPLGAGYVEFHNGGFTNIIGRTLRITINIPANNLSTPPVVKVWTITQFPIPASVAPVAPTIPLTYSNGTYAGTVTIPDFDRLPVAPLPGWVGMEVTNPQTNGAKLDSWSYQADIIAPTPTPTSTFTPTPTASPTP